jgi:hypothetical protein
MRVSGPLSWVATIPFLILPAGAQTGAVDAYLTQTGKPSFFAKSERDARRPLGDLGRKNLYDNFLPLTKTNAFAGYVAARNASSQGFGSAAQLAADAVSGQFNKLLGSSVGAAGTTSVTSGSAVSSVLSLAMEYGAITQSNSGNVATLRTNLFSLVSPLVGGQVFPTCTNSSKNAPCGAAASWLRKLSASYSAETSGTATATTTGTNAQTGSTNTTNIFGGGYRTAGWSVRVDWLAANPYKVADDQFTKAMGTIGQSAQITTLQNTVGAVFAKQAVQDLYAKWEQFTIQDLESSSDEADGKQRLAADLDSLIAQVRQNDSDFDSNIVKARNAYQGYYDLLDSTIQSLQTNKFSTEFTAQHPLGQANTSNFRAIYSWQPAKAPLLLTFNGAFTWYDSIPADVKAVKAGKLRDAQVSIQLDRKFDKLGSLQNSVFTIAGYYQWQIENALITIDSGNMAPGTSITLPGTAATLLAPKGNIAIAQLKWTLPVKNGVVKIPFSFTWANRTELVNETEKRGQVGLTFDLDSVFAKGSQ